MANSLFYVKLTLLHLLLLTLCNVSYSCSGLSGMGYTYPMGDIFIEYNTSTPLEITCVITNETLIQNNPNISSQLYFKKNGSRVPEEKILRLNDTSIKLIDRNLEAMSSFYMCMFNDAAICLNSVHVDTKPQPVKDFKCIGYNYENLTCSWTPPINHVKTNYSLSYTFPHTRPGRRINNCTITEKDMRQQCFWSLYTSPHYKQSQEVYKFFLRAENRFGSLEQSFIFYHLKNILSNPPEKLMSINSTTSSLFLSWKIPNPIAPLVTGLEHRILYQCAFGPKIWQNGGLIESIPHQMEVRYNLTGLKHAHDLCDIRVSIRVKGAETEEMWSRNASITSATSSTIPSRPPKMNIGSFENDITSNLRDIYVYWQQIPTEIRNADNFQYVITLSNSKTNANITRETSDSYVKFAHMSLNASYKFTIRSKNSVGLSKNSTVLKIPAVGKMISEPVSFTKVAFGNGVYKLSWEKPKKNAHYVQNYTLFWCNAEKDRPFQCNGFLNWTEVPETTSEYNITIPKENITQFAISANNATSTSGMVWATCTLIYNKLITKIDEVWIFSVGSRHIELKWKLYCADRSGSIAGYIIYYCQRTKEPYCLDNTRNNVTIYDPYADSGKITNLTPYTTYILSVAVISKQGSVSAESDVLFNTTYQAAPSEPLDLKAIYIGNTSISLTWKAPVNLNGFLTRYEVYYNDMKAVTGANQTSMTLNSLQDDSEFNISVIACTSLCSPRSLQITVRTKIGYPDPITNVWSSREYNHLVLQWSKPNRKLPYISYQIYRKYKSTASDNITLPIVNISKTSYVLTDCNIDVKEYYVSVRAVNQDQDLKYMGPWSEELPTSCTHTPISRSFKARAIWLTITYVLIVVVGVAIIAVGKRFYVFYNKMKCIDVALPPGLDPHIDLVWTLPTRVDPSDADHLLNTTSIRSSSESSACFSGEESSSCTPSITISDSGTEQTPHTLTDLGTNHSVSESNTDQSYESDRSDHSQSSADLLRYLQNGNGYSRYSLSETNTQAIEMTNLSQKSRHPEDESKPASGSYMPLDNIHIHSSPYVMAASEEMILPTISPCLKSQYVTCDQAIRHPEVGVESTNTSYIPKDNIQIHSPPYVMAASKEMISPAISTELISQNVTCDQIMRHPEDGVELTNSSHIPVDNIQMYGPPYVMAASKETILPATSPELKSQNLTCDQIMKHPEDEVEPTDSSNILVDNIQIYNPPYVMVANKEMSSNEKPNIQVADNKNGVESGEEMNERNDFNIQ